MGYSEYLAAREFIGSIGQPVITYILMVSVLQGILALIYLIRKDGKYYDQLKKCLYINAGLYVLGFFFLIWFHIQIYNSILIEYPLFLRQLIPVESSRFVIPLWIESEKLYFWGMMSSIFILTVKKKKDLISFLCIILAVFSAIVYFFSNPFIEPLPTVHGEITRWFSAVASGDIGLYQLAGTLYGRITFFYNSTYMWIHPPILFIAYASLIITAAACVYMLAENDKVYDDIAYMYAKIGYILLTTGMLIGYPWAIEAWKDSAWWWDPKINGSIMMWALYSAYLHAHIYTAKGKMWKGTAYLGILCFVSLVFTYLLTYIVPGIHSVVQP